MQQILKVWLRGEIHPIYTRVEGRTSEEAIRSFMGLVISTEFFLMYDTDGTQFGIVSDLVVKVQAV